MIAGKYPVKLYMRLWWVFLQYFWMHLFVWARVVCGTRSYQSASVGCSQIIQKIHMRKIERQLDIVNMVEMWQMSCPDAIRQAQMDVSGPRGPRWRAMLNSTWLEELASESNTIQAQEDIMCQGRLLAISRWNYIWVWVGYLMISLDQCVRFGSRLLWT